jgi:spore germination protein PD
MLNFTVHNHQLCVGRIEVLGIASSSLLQVGDTSRMALYSMFDTPPESVIVGSMAPLPEPEGAEAAVEETTVTDFL